MGSSVFKEGSIVTGCENKFNNTVFSAILDTSYTLGTVKTYIKNFEGATAQTADGLSKIKIHFVVTKDEDIWSSISTTFIVFSSISGDNLKSSAILSLINPDTNLSDPNYSLKVSDISTAISSASTVIFHAGILFLNGCFTYVPEQSIILDPYSSTPTVSIGFDIVDKIVTYKDDFSLLDNSYIENKEFNNPNEQGADRFVKMAVLTKKQYIDNTTFAEQFALGNFFEYLRIYKGNITKNINTTIYSDIETELARRTYEESGNFTTKPFIVKVVDSITDNPISFSLEISPGKAYVLGYEFDSVFTRHIDILKTLEYGTKPTYALSTYYGSYIKIQDVTGFFDIQRNQKIDLYKVVKGQITSFATRVSNKIGEAYCRYLRKIGTSFWLYIYNITMSNGTFDSVLSVGVSDQLTIDHGLANLAVSKIFDPTNDRLLFQFPESSVRSINTSSYTVHKCFRDKIFSK